jgi:methylmalonyl-CoA/ethylmalonyl-CoA epimerase
MKIKRVKHIAIAVENLESAIDFWQGILGIKLDHIEEVPSQKARVAFLPVGDCEVELVQPTVNGSGTAKFIREHGPGMHHLCFEVEGLDEMLEEMKSKGIRLINEQPVEMEDRRLAFIHPKSTGGVLLELYELK